MDSRISGLKHLAIYLVIVAIIGAGGWGVYYYRVQQSRPQSHQFVGQLVQIIDSNNLVVKGVRINDVNPDKSDPNHPMGMLVKITSDTKFVETVLHRPSKESLIKTNGVWDMKSVKKETIVGKVSDLTLESSVSLKADTDISAVVSFTATEIDYSRIVD